MLLRLQDRFYAGNTRHGLRAFGICAWSLAFLGFLVSCGLQVGTGTYISERNVSQRKPSDMHSGYGAAKAGHETGDRVHASAPSPAGGARQGKNIVSTARSQSGTPYRSGGDHPSKGFDCSGLIFWVYKQHGISVPRVARAQASFGRSVPNNALMPGDIVAFNISGGYHTGIYSGKGNFIHSPSTGSKVREENINTKYWRKTFVGARRIL